MTSKTNKDLKLVLWIMIPYLLLFVIAFVFISSCDTYGKGQEEEDIFKEYCLSKNLTYYDTIFAPVCMYECYDNDDEIHTFFYGKCKPK